ncbi:methyl-accepting chemotaxis protein [Pseudoalteromonas denitrificans]|uniref:Methyl-accepting chemotaxis protein n=1 Tax=Pseudoalteromonas denitrificans DSM 6059 TaxID=1123010 RepID=A0A1I1MZS1_9GAMM|nr:methyl-accepting chemotaxis protein [Pseudoalteromonas denitrificans]SFC90675.1 methyl-accepting chemotaxis protein [Pseudoalteromonas denitrificans DSM 6059]
MSLTIRSRLLILSVSLVFFPLILAVSVLGNSVIEQLYDELYESNQRALISIREQKAQQLEGYLDVIKGQIITYSYNSMISDAAQKFGQAFITYKPNLNSEETQSALNDYYKNEFSKKYQDLNGKNTSIDALLPKNSSIAQLLQFSYIANNPQPLGGKDALISANDDSSYSKIHKEYHPQIRQYLNVFGYYDIFIVDHKSADIVYSVFKELDYATNLKTGPYSQSGLAKAFNGAVNLSKDEFYMTNFDNYLPSYDAAAAFIASPIYKDGKQLGVLIFQMPIGKINQIMTSNNKWADIGLGESGETYLVGLDGTLRNQSRFLLDDKKNYLSALRASGQIEEANIIERTDNVILVQKVDTLGSRAALKGETGFKIFPDYRNVPVLSAYKRINSGGEPWALMAEIDEDEAFAPFYDEMEKLIISSSITVLIFLGIGIGVGYLVAQRISYHVTTLSTVMDNISQGDGDLTYLIDYDGKNEFGDISRAFNRIINKIKETLLDVRHSSKKIEEASHQVSEGASDSIGMVEEQGDATRSMAAALEEFEATVNDVAQNTDNSQKISNQVVEDCKKNGHEASLAVTEIEQLVSDLNTTSSAITELNKEVGEITSVLNVINSIADQTNLLALNAAIEAARAGEHGRGFAVVAEEVRNLAFRTQESTIQIQERLTILSNATNQAVTAMSKASGVASDSIEHVSQLNSGLDSLILQVNEMEQIIISVATATEEQSQTIGEINTNMSKVDNLSSGVFKRTQSNQASSNSLTQVSTTMRNLVNKFKLD